MYRFRRNLQRHFTTATTTETIPEHFNKNAKFYGVILTSVTLLSGVIWGRIAESERRLEKDIKELKEDMKEDMKELKEDMKGEMKEMKKELRDDIREIKDLLIPLVVRSKVEQLNTKSDEKNC